MLLVGIVDLQWPFLPPYRYLCVRRLRGPYCSRVRAIHVAEWVLASASVATNCPNLS
jgi:hypothetical protein